MYYKYGICTILISCLAISMCTTPNDSNKLETLPYRDTNYEQTINGTIVHYTISIPKTYDSLGELPLILALHFGGDQTTYYGQEFLNFLVKPALESLDVIFLAPTCPSPVGWTDEISEGIVMALIDTVTTHYRINRNKILVTGFSLGGIGTWHYAAKFPQIFGAAIPIASSPQSSITALIQDIPLYVIHSDADEIFPVQDLQQVVTELQSRGVDVEFKIVENASHYNTTAFIIPLYETIPWIKQHWGE